MQLLHEKVYNEVLEKLKNAYSKVPIGDPMKGESASVMPHVLAPSCSQRAFSTAPYTTGKQWRSLSRQ